MADTTMAVANLIAQRRAELGLSISRAAKRAGVSRSTWQRVERGESTTVLARTLAQFDEALQLESGTLYRLGSGSPDFIVQSVPERVLHIELKVTATESVDDTEARKRMARLAEQLDIDDVWTVLAAVRTLPSRQARRLDGGATVTLDGSSFVS